MGGIVVIAATIAVFAIIDRASGSDAAQASEPVVTAAAPSAGRPSREPGPGGGKPAPVAEPRMPVLTPDEHAQLAAEVRDAPAPGAAAFRKLSDRYVDENLELAQRQASAEGLSLPEVRELTYFGLLAMATQRFDDVEEITGRPLGESDRAALGELMQGANGDFRTQMRALVGRRGAEAERWALIRETQARYQRELFRITGLDASTLDDLLAGNLALPGAPARQEEPTGARAEGGYDDAVGDVPPRPRRQ